MKKKILHFKKAGFVNNKGLAKQMSFVPSSICTGHWLGVCLLTACPGLGYRINGLGSRWLFSPTSKSGDGCSVSLQIADDFWHNLSGPSLWPAAVAHH